MSINTSWTKIIVPHGNIEFNVDVGTADQADYYPMVINLDVTPQTPAGVTGQQVRITKRVGTNRPTAFVFSTVAGIKEWYQALPAFAQPMVKEGVIAVINEDASA